jgi:hypothetical protein
LQLSDLNDFGLGKFARWGDAGAYRLLRLKVRTVARPGGKSLFAAAPHADSKKPIGWKKFRTGHGSACTFKVSAQNRVG